MKFSSKVYLEVIVKDLLILFLAFFFFTPWIISSQKHLPKDLQGSVLSMMGFLMAAAIIGAFELTYSRTNINIWYLRYLAHATKFLLYTGIILLMMIAMTAMGTTPGFFNDPIAFSSILILSSLFMHDIWDIVKSINTA